VGAVWIVASTELRRRLRTTVVFVLVAGVAAGFAITTGVGARRAWTAWDRFRAATLAPTGSFSTGGELDDGARTRVSRMPGVEAIGTFSYVPVAPAPFVPGEDAGAFVALDRSIGNTIYRPLVVAGRHADPRRAEEITINEELAAKGLKVGQRVRLRNGFGDEAKDIGAATVVGIVRGQFDLGIFSENGATYLTYAFLDAHRDELQLAPQDGAMVRLRGGEAGRARFERALQRDFGPLSFAPPGDPLGEPVRQVLDVQKVAWLLLAAAAGLAVLLAVRQALVRVVAGIGANAPTLRALGMRRPQLAAVGVTQTAILGTAIAIIGMAIGIGASSLVPSGLAHRADPDRGIRVEPAVLAASAVVLLLVLVSGGALAAWRAWGDWSRRTRTSRIPRRGPLPLVLGSEWALGTSPGPARGSARSALVAVAVALAGVVGLVTFAASNDELHATPRLHGWGFDAVMTAESDPAEFASSHPRLASDPDVTGLAWGALVYVIVDGQPLEAFVLEQAKGGLVHPTLLEGRAPAGPGEISLGSGTLRRLGKHVGDTVSVLGKEGPQRLRVVGRAAYPEVGNNGDVLHAGSLTRSALTRVESLPTVALGLVRVRDGMDPARVIARDAGDDDGFETSAAFEPKNVKNLGAVGAIPWALAAFLAALGLVAVGHALAMSVRARRGDIAMLRTLGLVRRQVRWSVAAQASTTVIAGAVVGLPIGVAVGRVVWSLVADGLGVVDRPIVPAAVVVLAAGAALVVANLMAAVPAVIAGRLRPAAILRTE
jgi:hypothetical protein